MASSDFDTIGAVAMRPSSKHIVAFAVAMATMQVPETQSQQAVLRDAIGHARAGKPVPAMGILEIRGGKVIGETQVGLRRMDRPDSVRRGDRWALGSDTKAMTATLIALLVDRGVLSWTARLDQMMPDLAATMRPEYRDVTLLDLLSHRSGLPAEPADTMFFRTFYDDRQSLTEQRMRWVRTALTDAPAAPKRAAISYSNTNYILVAAIAERAAGKSYESMMRDEIFKPLGMTSAGFDHSPNGPVGHIDGRPATRQSDLNPVVMNSAGRAEMSIDDWAKFCIDQMNGPRGKGRLLKAATYTLMQTPQGETNSGLGWGVVPTVSGRMGPGLTHAGSDGNWFALAALFPKTGNGILIVANAGDQMGGHEASVALLNDRVRTLAPPAAASK